jgi:hypothetical protein
MVCIFVPPDQIMICIFLPPDTYFEILPLINLWFCGEWKQDKSI